MYKLLVVDDDSFVRDTVIGNFKDEGYSVSGAGSGAEALDMMRKESFDVMLLDMRMPGMNGIETLKEVRKIDPELPVIIITGHGDIPTAIECTKLGAFDFLMKPPNFEHLFLVVRNAIEKKSLKGSVDKLNSELNSSLESTLGRSAQMKSVIEQIKRIAHSDYSLVIKGETGVGKTFVARVVHNLSRHAAQKFVTVDIGAIPETLVENELFGHERGSFTGAEKRKSGLFESGNGGTIFIDEIQNIPPSVQAKLLRAVDEKKIARIGSEKEIPIDVRLISATNADMDKIMTDGGFRRDLYFRLNEVSIEIPPLRERPVDIEYFCEMFLSETCDELDRKKHHFSEEALQLLKAYKWPGNVRELKNVVRRAVLFSKDFTINASEIAPLLKNDKRESKSFELPVMSFKEAEIYMIKKALKTTGGNKSKAALLLQTTYRTLLRKMKEYDILL
ncbi:MAG: sigma-54-dependent Fis family transcriptional regulator [Nitrospirae bacterium]|nr:sigma-54-dependent Fis family transcriptional regulator [Nitrospirota bacterium]